MPAHNLRGRWWAKRLWWSFVARLRNQHIWLYGDRVTNVRNFELVFLGQRILRKACTNGSFPPETLPRLMEASEFRP